MNPLHNSHEYTIKLAKLCTYEDRMPSSLPPSPPTHLCKLSGQVIGKELFFLLIVHGQCLLLFLERVYLLEESIRDILLLLLSLGLLQDKGVNT